MEKRKLDPGFGVQPRKLLRRRILGITCCRSSWDPLQSLSVGSCSVSAGTSVSLYRNHCIGHKESVLTALQVGERYLQLKTAGYKIKKRWGRGWRNHPKRSTWIPAIPKIKNKRTKKPKTKQKHKKSPQNWRIERELNQVPLQKVSLLRW